MISIIIVNYNKKDLLKSCLDSIRAQDFQDIEVIVIDNASKDDSVEMLKTYYPEVRLIWNTSNLLFCKAQNQGIEASKGEFVLCLNNDCFLDKGYLEEALYSMALDPRIGMVSGKILRMDRKTVDSTGLFVGRNRKPVERGYGKLDKGQHEKPGYVFGVSGACAFFRKGMLLDIKDENGYFDENFGMYYEDLDLCWRANKKGWKAYYNPKAIAYHARGATAVVHNGNGGLQCRPGLNLAYIEDRLKKMYIKNRYRCIRKNDSIIGIMLHLPFILLYEVKIYGYIFGNFLLTSIKRHSII